MKLKSGVLLFLPFWSLVGYAQYVPTITTKRYVQPEIIDLIQRAQQSIKDSTPTSSIKCQPGDKLNCSFVSYCDKFKVNKNADNLYQNEKGEIIPNFEMDTLKTSLEQCHQTIDSNVKEIQSFSQKSLKESLQKKADFLASVKSHGEEENVNRIDQALVEIALKNTENSNEPPPAEISRKEIEQKLNEAISLSGADISDETKQKWIDRFDNSSLKNGKKIYLSQSQNPFLNWDLLFNEKIAGSKEELAKNQQEFQKQSERAFGVFQDTKKQIIEVLIKKKNGKNDAEIENMITRISTIKMASSAVGVKSSFTASCASPNAYYQGNTHTFTICPQILQVPESALQDVIAHELGHSIDPCHMNTLLTEKNYTPPHSTKADIALAERASEAGMQTFKPTLPEQLGGRFQGIDESSDLNQPEPSSPVRAEKIPLSKNPLSSVITCLNGSQSVDAAMGEPGKAEKNVRDKIEELKKAGATANNPKIIELNKILDKVKSTYPENKACSRMEAEHGHSQMQEAFSDWIATEVTAQKIKAISDPEAKRQTAFEAASFFFATSCESYFLDSRESAQNALLAAKCINTQAEENRAIHEDNDPHPMSSKRVENILFAHPTVRSALGCNQKEKVKHCE